MSGSLLTQARKDAKAIISSGGFQEVIVLKTPSGDRIVEIKGLASKHHLRFGSDGMPMSAKNAHACIDEDTLITLNYPYRNAKQEVHLKNHLVDIKDTSGVLKHYVVSDHYPDETLGLIVLILGDWQL